MQEIWKDIAGYENLYQVSNLGNVISLFRTNKPKTLKPTPSNCGYYKVQLYKNGHPQMFYVHRLVAEAFIPNPNKKSQVNHIDGIKSNNCLTNLEWVSPSENQKHSISLGLRSSSPMVGKIGKLNHQSKPIMQFSKSGDLIKVWDCISDASRYFNCKPSNISNCASGRYKSSQGYVWKYTDF